jgi:serine/alanine adding enzyme
MNVAMGRHGADVSGLVEVYPTCDSRWDAFVASRRDASIFHHSAWLRTLEAEYGGRVLGLACEGSGGELFGVLPLLLTRGLPIGRKDRLSGRRLSSLPRTPTAGPLAVDRASTETLVRGAVDRVRSQPGLQLQLKLKAPYLDGLVDGVEGERWRHTFVLELPPTPVRLRFGNARNHGRIRWAVNKAERLNVRVRPAETEADLRAWYRLYVETMRLHAVPPRPCRLFSAMWGLLRPQRLMDLLLAEHVDAVGTRLLAGSIFLKFRDTVFYAFNGSHRSALSLRPNDIIMWRAIHDASAAGYRRFDLGEVDESAPTLADFKSKWGAKPSWLYRYYYPAQRAEHSTSDGMAVRAAQALWRHLPLQATVILGDRIYSYL